MGNGYSLNAAHVNGKRRRKLISFKMLLVFSMLLGTNAWAVSSIVLSQLTPGPFGPFCAGSSVSLRYDVALDMGVVLDPANTFTFQLTINGTDFVNIGTLVGNGVSGTISGTIPLNTPSGTTYKLRLNSSNAAITGTLFSLAPTGFQIAAVPTAQISYSSASYCKTAGPQAATLLGTTGGTYSSTPAGLTIDPAGVTAGLITPATSSAGSYAVKYTTPANTCASIEETTSITIVAPPIATFSYQGNPFCRNAGNPSPTLGPGAVAGVFSSSPGLVFVSTATGQINLAASTSGTYLVTNTIAAGAVCGQVTATSQITITTLPVSTFTYTANPYCSNLSDPLPTFSGGGGAGIFSSTVGLVFLNTASGQVDLSASTGGSYTVTNTFAAAGGCPAVSSTSPLVITVAPVASFSYSGTPYCKNAINPSPVFNSGGLAGTFSSTTGLVFINVATGQVNLATSTSGTYTVTNTIAAANGCGVVTATSTITITTPPVATFSYSGSPYCNNSGDPLPTFAGGGVAGVFTSSPGLVFINSSTGAVDLSASTGGTFSVLNTIAASGGCPLASATASVTITVSPVATFNYTGNPFCKNAANPSPVLSGIAGTFSSTAGLVFANPATGQINLAGSTAGTYSIVNTIGAANGCAVVTASSSVTLTALPVATISYPGTPFCSSEEDPLPILEGGALAGVFSSTAGLVFLSTSTGKIDLSASTEGNYVVTNTVLATGGCPAVSDTAHVNIRSAPSPEFNYSAAAFCKDGANPAPVFINDGVAGVFSSLPTTGLVFVNPSTGVINNAASSPGTFEIVNTIAAAGGCPLVSHSFTISLTAPPDVATVVSYPGNPFCKTISEQQEPSVLPASTGTFVAAPAGLSIAESGEVVPATSIAGTYQVTYTVVAAGGCAALVKTTSVTIHAAPELEISTFNDQTVVCSPSTITLNSDVSNGVTPYAYQWLRDGVSISGTAATRDSFIVDAGDAEYRLQITAGSCIIVSSSIQVVVRPADERPQKPVIIDPGDLICRDSRGITFELATEIESYAQAIWSVQPSGAGEIQFASRAAAMVDFTGADTIAARIYVTAFIPGCSASDTLIAAIDTFHTAPDQAVIQGLGNPVNYFECLDNTAEHYQWGFNLTADFSETLISGATFFFLSQDYSPSDANLFVKISNQFCTTKSFYGPVLSVDESFRETPLQVYPNPSAGRFTISDPLLNFLGTQVDVYDITGKSAGGISSTANNGYSDRLTVEHSLTPGFYLIRLRAKNGSSKVGLLSIIAE